MKSAALVRARRLVPIIPALLPGSGSASLTLDVPRWLAVVLRSLLLGLALIAVCPVEGQELPPGLSVSPASLPQGLVGAAYSQTLTATGCAGPYTWSVLSGTLPGGFSLSSGGVISGTPTVGGSFTFFVQVTGSGCSGGATFTLHVGPWITTWPVLPTAAVGAGYSQALSAAGGAPPYAWSVASGTLPAGFTLSSAGVISGAPTTAEASTFGITVTDSAAATASQTFSLTVNPPRSQLSVQYLLTATGGPSASLIVPAFIATDVVVAASALTSCTYYPTDTCVYAAVSPSGPGSGGRYLEFDIAGQSGGGGLGGSAWYFQDGAFTSIGEYSSVTGATSATLSVSYIPTPDTPPATLFTSLPKVLIATTPLLPGGAVGAAYWQILSGSLGSPPYTWSVAPGTLPAGLSLSSSGVISGTPTATGTSTFGITVTDSAYNTESQTFLLTVYPFGPLAITTASALPGAVAGTVYSQTLTASGGVPPYTWSRTAVGTPPAGLALSSAGVISGTPTAVGTSVFGIAVTDSTSATVSQTFSLTVGLLLPLTITTTSPLPSGVAGTVYSQTLTASGGVPPYIWSRTAGALPAGLTLSSAGVISGTPTTLGTSTFAITLTDANSATASQTFSLTINPAPLLIASASSLPSGVAGTAYAQTLTGTGGVAPYTWAVASGSLPPLLTLSASGVIGGIPAEAGVSTFTVSVYDSSQHSATQTFTLTITLGALTTVTPSVLTSGVVGAAYSQTLAATGGVPPYTWQVVSGSWPVGLSMSSAGALTGTPTTAGSYAFAAKVTDSASETATQTFSLTVAAAGTLTRAGVISQIAAGGGWDSTIWLVNGAAVPVQTSVAFHGDDGGALSLPLTVTQPGYSQQVTTSTLQKTIAPNTMLVVATGTVSSTIQGWADVLANGALSGFAVFRYNGASEVTAPLQSQFGTSVRLPFDQTSGYTTGIALVNLAGWQANVTATVWDQYGNQVVAQQPIAFAKTDSSGHGHDAFMLSDLLPVTAGARGIVQFQSNPLTPLGPVGQLAGLGLRASPAMSVTSLPTIVQ
jgi:hypothetical protein